MKRNGFISHNDFITLVGLVTFIILVIMLMILRIFSFSVENSKTQSIKDIENQNIFHGKSNSIKRE